MTYLLGNDQRNGREKSGGETADTLFTQSYTGTQAKGFFPAGAFIHLTLRAYDKPFFLQIYSAHTGAVVINTGDGKRTAEYMQRNITRIGVVGVFPEFAYGGGRVRYLASSEVVDSAGASLKCCLCQHVYSISVHKYSVNIFF